MLSHRFGGILRFGVGALILSAVSCSSVFAQGPSFALPRPSAESSAVVTIAPSLASSEHRFWDTKNRTLFGTVAGLNVADFAVTQVNLHNGGRELNPVARVFGTSTSGLAANVAGENAGVIGLSYLFHRTGHHKLERIVSMVNIGASAGAISYGLTHR
jgi:hypothetical protein